MTIRCNVYCYDSNQKTFNQLPVCWNAIVYRSNPLETTTSRLISDGVGWLFAYKRGEGIFRRKLINFGLFSYRRIFFSHKAKLFFHLLLCSGCFACFWQRSACFACKYFRYQLNRRAFLQIGLCMTWQITQQIKPAKRHDRQLTQSLLRLRLKVPRIICRAVSKRSDITFTINLDSKIDILCLSVAVFEGFALRQRSHRKISDLTVNLSRAALKIRSARTRLMRFQFPNTNLFKVFNLSSLPTIDFFEQSENWGIRPFCKRAKKLFDFLWAPFSPPSPFPVDGLW